MSPALLCRASFRVRGQSPPPSLSLSLQPPSTAQGTLRRGLPASSRVQLCRPLAATSWPGLHRPACCFLPCPHLVPPRPRSARGHPRGSPASGKTVVCQTATRTHTLPPTALGPAALPEGGSCWAACPPHFPQKHVPKGRLHTRVQGDPRLGEKKGGESCTGFQYSLKSWSLRIRRFTLQ